MKIRKRVILGSGLLLAAGAFAATGLAGPRGADSAPAHAVSSAAFVVNGTATEAEPPEGICFAKLKTDAAGNPNGVHLSSEVTAAWTGKADEASARAALADIAAGDIHCETGPSLFGELDEIPTTTDGASDSAEVVPAPPDFVEVVPGAPDSHHGMPLETEAGDGIVLSGPPAGSFFAELDADDLGVTPPEGVDVFGFVDALYEKKADADSAKAAVREVSGKEPQASSFDDVGFPGGLEDCLKVEAPDASDGPAPQ